MDDLLKNLDQLFAMARSGEPAPPLDSAAVLRRIDAERAGSSLGMAAFVGAPSPVGSLAFCLGIGSGAAILALVVGLWAASAWTSLHDPLSRIGMLPDIFSFLQIG